MCVCVCVWGANNLLILLQFSEQPGRVETQDDVSQRQSLPAFYSFIYSSTPPEEHPSGLMDIREQDICHT